MSFGQITAGLGAVKDAVAIADKIGLFGEDEKVGGKARTGTTSIPDTFFAKPASLDTIRRETTGRGSDYQQYGRQGIANQEQALRALGPLDAEVIKLAALFSSRIRAGSGTGQIGKKGLG